MNSADSIFKYFPNLSPRQKEQIELLQPLYEEWNEKINVISRKDIDSLYEKHVLHSLAIHKFISFQPGSAILDIGTGGGFPGIPLAIVQPAVHFTLVDSIGKKIKVVRAVADALQLQNVTAIHERAEKLKTKFDFVLTRAVAPLPELMMWCNGKFRKQQLNAIPNGLICLKGGDLHSEIQSVKKSTQVFELAKYFEGEFFETKKLVYVVMN